MKTETYEDRVNSNIGGYFWSHNRRCMVTAVTTFAGVYHYYFSTVDLGVKIHGWIPVGLVGQTELSA